MRLDVTPFSALPQIIFFHFYYQQTLDKGINLPINLIHGTIFDGNATAQNIRNRHKT